MLDRNIRPSCRETSVSAISTVISMVSPALLIIDRGELLRLGAEVRVASAPGRGVPASAVGGTHAGVAEAWAAGGTGLFCSTGAAAPSHPATDIRVSKPNAK